MVARVFALLERSRIFLIVAAAYLATAAGALAFSEGPDHTSTIWVPSGIVLAALLLRPRKDYIQILAGAIFGSLAANLSMGASMATTMQFTAANVLETMAVIAALHMLRIGEISFDSPRNVIDFAVVCLLSTVVGTVSAIVLSGDYNPDFAASWIMTVLLGQTVFTPLLVTTFRGMEGFTLGRLAGSAGGMAIVVLANLGVTLLVFGQNSVPLLFLPVLPVLLATYRFGPIGAAIGVTIVALVGSLCTINGLGPCAGLAWSGMDKIQFFQFYLVTLLIAALPLAAALVNRAAAARETEQQKRLFEMASQSAHIGHWRFDLPRNCLIWSDEVFRIHELPIGEAPSLDAALNFYPPCDQVRVLEMLEECITSRREFAFDASITTAKGAVRHVASRGGAIVGPDDSLIAIFGVFQDVTDRVLANQQLATAMTQAENRAVEAQILAETDVLTGVPNRRKMMAMLEIETLRAQESAGELAIAVLDIDHFKSINDRHGHGIGDRVLKSVARASIEVLRGTDGFGRIGGEEFIMILPGADIHGARRIVERLRTRVQDGTGRDPELPGATVSIGVAAFVPGMSMEDLFSAADRALYAAKKDGRNLVMVA